MGNIKTAQAAITKCYRLQGLNNTNVFSHSSGGQMWVPTWLSPTKALLMT